jgi:hypothetical protein
MNKQSPRHWLLARHTAATPQLDSARRAALATVQRDAAPVPISQLLPALFFPNRGVWTALAATWLLLTALHFAQRPPALTSPSTPELSHAELAARTDWFVNRQAQLHALLR